MSMQFRDYLYLDLMRLQDYMSSLDMGDLQELRETVRQTDARSDIPMAAPGRGLEPEKPQREDIREKTLSISAKHSFNRLYEKLEGDLIDLDDNNTGRISKNSIVEATRDFEPSPVAQMVESLMDLIRMMQSLESPELKDPESQQVIAMISVLFRGDESKELDIPVVSKVDSPGYSIFFSAQRRYLLRDPDELTGELTLVGKVRKIVPAEGQIDLLELSNVMPRVMRRSAASSKQFRDGIVELFSNWPKELGAPLDPEALEMKGPAVIIDPLAVYT